MGYPLFILLTAVLFLRPEELVPGIEGVRLYLITISLCVLANLPVLLRVIGDVPRTPAGACVLGLLLAIPLSLVARGRVGEAIEHTGEFAKVIIYYLLLIAVLDTPDRLRGFLGWAAGQVLVSTVLAVCQFHGIIDVEALKPVEERKFDPATGETISFMRLCASGVFADPNDLCLALVFGMLCCGARAATASNPVRGAGWMLPIGMFVYAFTLTQSRGGLLGLLSAIATLIYGWFGWRRAVPLALLCLPALVLAMGGRQGSIEVGRGGTGFERVMLWAEGLTLVARSPLWMATGIGYGEYAPEMGLVAHNSFVHGYVELGLFGGTLYLAAWYWTGRRALTAPPTGDVLLARLRPFLLAMLAGFAAGSFSLSRNYVIPTYLILGLGMCYGMLAHPGDRPANAVRTTAILGVGGFVALKVLTMILGGMG